MLIIMIPRSLEQIERIVIYDDEGAGRCHIGKYAVKEQLEAILPNALFIAAGLRHPDSGRKIIHPSPAQSIYSRHGIDVSRDTVHLLSQEDINNGTICLGLTSTPAPDFLLEKAFDVLIAPAPDPFHDLTNQLEPIATQIGLIAWLFEWVLINKFNELGKEKEVNGLVRPRGLVTFQPLVEAKYDLRSPMNIRSHDDLDRPIEAWRMRPIGRSW